MNAADLLRKDAESMAAHPRRLCRILAFVQHHRVTAYLKCGWMVVDDLGPPHGEWSLLLGWPCDCEMELPEK